MDEAVQNTDRELWREVDGDYYADSIHVTESGGIKINVGGRVLVAPVQRWHEAGMKLFSENKEEADSQEPEKKSGPSSYLDFLST